MIPNPLLAITIPTYNRADFLDYSFEVHVPLARTYNVQIYISDNASTDSTKKVVEKWQQEYPLIHYYCNECNVGEINFEIALKLPATEYIWLLGDTYQIPINGISYLLETITSNQKYDALVFNLENAITSIPQQNYDNQNNLLNDIGALMTCLSCLVYHTSLIKEGNFSRYYNTHFVQTGIILEAIANRSFSIQWIQSLSIKNLNNPTLRKTNWSHTTKAFKIGAEDWSNFVFSLPASYKIYNKMKCIMDFGKVSGLFSFRNLYLLRIRNILNISSYMHYKKIFIFTVNIHSFLIAILAITPKWLLLLIGIIYILLFKDEKMKKIQRLRNGIL